MSKRLTAQDWLDFALKILAREGFQALKADVLARKMKVTRGSFYWHFPDLSSFHEQVIERWRLAATETIIAELEQHDSRERRLDVLLRRAFGRGSPLEVRMRTWADENPKAAKALREIDGRRQQYIERVLVESGVAPTVAATRTQLLYWAFLGAALNRTKLAGEALDRAVTELIRLALDQRASTAPSEPRPNSVPT